MVGRIRSLGLIGIHGYTVACECSLAPGLPSFDVVGLPDAAVKESRERVRAAARSMNLAFPRQRIVINLAPADTRKNGTIYDLPILLGILSASGEFPEMPDDCAFFGELSLSGELRRANGALPMALAAEKAGIRRLFVPADCAGEAAYAENVEVYPAESVDDILRHFDKYSDFEITPVAPRAIVRSEEYPICLSDVRGQSFCKRALEIAAAGGHNILMTGTPGSGKSMMAKRMPSIMPDMTRTECIEATEIYSVAGLTSREKPIITERPFRAPHHTISLAALSGGSAVPRPGEISLSHNGVLFLDELPEFPGIILEGLRAPLEDGTVTVARAAASVTYPCRFVLVAAMNPCKCGWHGHKSGKCTCSPEAVRRYRERLSGPLLDRIDMFVEVESLEWKDMESRPVSETSAVVRERVNAARQLQQARFAGSPAECNGQATSVQVEEFCALDEKSRDLMKRAFTRFNLTARSHDKILRVARTIADLAGSAEIQYEHLAESLQYRSGMEEIS
ncbi:MAG: YifB family Mg chelatase-like AAA ATPase [Oscillospiraceae bacterium]|jgi:magnesium chelatase family protein|nr:YifB family Mg chelatase-like AAA ATPase [Oscillospiraceae bacterium]